MTEEEYIQRMVKEYAKRPGVLSCIMAAILCRNITIDYIRVTKKGFVKRIAITKEKDTRLFERGYGVGIHVLQGWRYILIGKKHTFARILYFRCFDASTMGNFETSSTLNDHFESRAEEHFIKNLIKIKLDPLDMKRLGIIAAGVIVGVLGYIFIFGGI